MLGELSEFSSLSIIPDTMSYTCDISSPMLVVVSNTIARDLRGVTSQNTIHLQRSVLLLWSLVITLRRSWKLPGTGVAGGAVVFTEVAPGASLARGENLIFATMHLQHSVYSYVGWFWQGLF